MSKRSLTVTSTLWLALAGISGSVAASGQDATARPAFEVASVKAVSQDTVEGSAKAKMEELMQGMLAERTTLLPKDRGRLMLRNRSLISLVAAAYKVKTAEVIGPSWMSELRFDVEARIPEGASPEDANAMLQSLLEERFGLRAHREDRSLPGYALLVGKNGSRLKVSDGDVKAKPASVEESKARAEGQLKTMLATGNANGTGMMGGGVSRGFKNATSATLAQAISQLVHTPVVDMTELTGRYDVDLVIPPPQDPADGMETRVAQAVDQLGLKLESRKVPVAAVVVDSIARTPTAN